MRVENSHFGLCLIEIRHFEVIEDGFQVFPAANIATGQGVLYQHWPWPAIDGFLQIHHDIEATVGGGADLSPTMRADLRAAAVYATDVSREVAQWAHLAAGTTAIREGSRLERAFRDLYTGTQHAFISQKVAIDAAQVWLGLVDDPLGL